MPADPLQLALLTLLVLLGATVYSSGGHGGATAYLAAMALFGVAPSVMRPTALVLNIIVTAIGTARLALVRAVPWRLLAPLLLGSVPAAFFGGRVAVSSTLYRPLLGALLLVAAARLWLPDPGRRAPAAPRAPLLVFLGGALGLLAGLTGIGGGIFLSPLLLLLGWETPRRTAGAAAVFIFCNSVVGLAGQLSATAALPVEAAVLGGAVVLGGLLGSWLGAHRFEATALRRVNAVVLLFSGGKLLLESLR